MTRINEHQKSQRTDQKRNDRILHKGSAWKLCDPDREAAPGLSRGTTRDRQDGDHGADRI